MVMKNKYHNKKSFGFDSQKERRRYQELLLLQKIGEIKDLKKQVAFELIPTQKNNATGRVVERGVKYIADFTYTDRYGNFIVEDTKSPATKTDAYIIKRKLMLFVHNIKIKEL